MGALLVVLIIVAVLLYAFFYYGTTEQEREEYKKTKTITGTLIEVYYDDQITSNTTVLTGSSFQHNTRCVATVESEDGKEVTLYADYTGIENYLNQTITITYKEDYIISFQVNVEYFEIY